MRAARALSQWAEADLISESRQRIVHLWMPLRILNPEARSGRLRRLLVLGKHGGVYSLALQRAVRRAVLAMAAVSLCVGLVVGTAPVFAAESKVVKPELRFSRGLLWRVSRRGIAASYVFGTIHIPDPRVLLIPDAVTQALMRSKSYAMEIQFDPGAEARFFEAVRFEDGRRLETLIGADAYAQVRASLRQRDVPDEIIARLKPWAALANLIVTPADYERVTLDQKLYALARARRLPVDGLEGIEEQIAVFDGIPLATQVALLKHQLAEREYFVGLIEPTIQAWLRRDLVALEALHERVLTRFPDMAEHYRVLAKHIVQNRSAVMAHRLFLPLRRGRAFVAIGASHLYGETGVLRLLQKQGYRVSAVY